MTRVNCAICRVASMPSRRGHPHVYQCRVWSLVAGEVDGFPAIDGLADDLDVRCGLEDEAEAGADQFLVVGEEHADHEPFTGSRVMRLQPPRSRGPVSR
jgi:hypothetical protein